MFLDIILVEPEIIRQAGYEFTISDLILHIVAETIATIIVEGIIFAIFCKEVKFRKIAFINAVTCIGLHIVYYFLASKVFSPGYFPPKADFKLIVHLLLTGHIQIIDVLEIIVFLIEYLFYIHDKKKMGIVKVDGSASLNDLNENIERKTQDLHQSVDNRKIFLVTLLSNFVAFFVGIMVSAGITLMVIRS